MSPLKEGRKAMEGYITREEEYICIYVYNSICMYICICLL